VAENSAPSDDTIVVRVYKYDGRPHRTWRARVAEQNGSLIILDAAFEEEVEHDLLGKIALGTISKEFYWLDRWYNVFRFLHDDGSTRLYYCNINKPPVFDGQSLTYIDLDIDVMVRPDCSYEVLDRDEFEANAERYGYSAEEKAKAAGALEEILGRIQSREFPFQPLSF
jgi:protein associated with RNAse G/E